MVHAHLEFQKYDLKALTDMSLQRTGRKPVLWERNILPVSQRVDKMEAVVDATTFGLHSPSNCHIGRSLEI